MKVLLIIALLLIPVVAMAEFTGTFQLYGGDTITDAKTGTSGARFTYDGTDNGVYYSLYGRVWVPNTSGGTYPGIITCHGAGGGPDLQYDLNTAMRGWGAITITVCLGHASAAQDNLCPGSDCYPMSAADAGAAEENTQRIMKAVDMLANIGSLSGFSAFSVDATRLALHGHSAGAYSVTRCLNDYPNTFRVASHTGGGYWGYNSECTGLDFPADCCTGDGTGSCTGCPLGANYCPRYPSEIAAIITPYSLNKGTADTTVPLIRDQDLERILIDIGCDYELNTYAGLTHQQTNLPPDNAPVLANILTWYTTYNMFTSGNSTTTTVLTSTTTVAVTTSVTTTVVATSTTTTATICGGTATGAIIQ